ncbi:MAG: N-acetylmuramoyl-L-alanine amidase [bacterium]
MLRKRFTIACIVCAVVLANLSSGAQPSESPTAILGIRFSTNPSFTRIIIECDGDIIYSQNLLRFPDRLYFDLQNTLPGKSRNEIAVDDPAVKSIRVGIQDGTTSRIVIHLKSYSDYTIYSLEDPSRLVVEINHEEKREEPPMPKRKVVVIDPGHGGHDPGAIGRRGLKEKEVTLDAALKLKEILESRYGVQVYLTRETDRFLELSERTDYANSRRADLFISLHVNASPNRKTRGIETWFLNNPSNEYDQRVAARENAISEEKMKQSQTELGLILTSLNRELKREESIRLARYIQSSLVKNMTIQYKNSIDDHGIKYSFFYVLLGAEMPAVLIETGFITNLDDELLLRKSTYRKDLAQAIAKAIHSYLSTLPDYTKLAKR